MVPSLLHYRGLGIRLKTPLWKREQLLQKLLKGYMIFQTRRHNITHTHTHTVRRYFVTMLKLAKHQKIKHEGKSYGLRTSKSPH